MRTSIHLHVSGLLLAILMTVPAAADDEIALKIPVFNKHGDWVHYPLPRTDRGIGYVYAVVDGEKVEVCRTILPSTVRVDPAHLLTPEINSIRGSSIDAGFSLFGNVIPGTSGASVALKRNKYQSVHLALTGVKEYGLNLNSLPDVNDNIVEVSDTCFQALKRHADQRGKLLVKVYVVAKAIAATGIDYRFSKNPPTSGGSPTAAAPKPEPSANEKKPETAEAVAAAIASAVTKPEDKPSTAQAAKPQSNTSSFTCTGTGASIGVGVTEIGDIHLSVCFTDTANDSIAATAAGLGADKIWLEAWPRRITSIALLTPKSDSGTRFEATSKGAHTAKGPRTPTASIALKAEVSASGLAALAR